MSNRLHNLSAAASLEVATLDTLVSIRCSIVLFKGFEDHPVHPGIHLMAALITRGLMYLFVFYGVVEHPTAQPRARGHLSSRDQS